MTFGEKIKRLRNERNWTQDFVSKKLNISAPALSRYESGACEPKDLAMVSEFAKLYGVSTDYLLGLSDERMHNGLEGNDLRIGLSREDEGILTDEDKDKIREFAQFIGNKRKENK